MMYLWYVLPIGTCLLIVGGISISLWRQAKSKSVRRPAWWFLCVLNCLACAVPLVFLTRIILFAPSLEERRKMVVDILYPPPSEIDSIDLLPLPSEYAVGRRLVDRQQSITDRVQIDSICRALAEATGKLPENENYVWSTGMRIKRKNGKIVDFTVTHSKKTAKSATIRIGRDGWAVGLYQSLTLGELLEELTSSSALPR